MTISGRIAGSDGQPLADVSVYGSDNTGGFGFSTGTDNEGRYQLLVRPGDYRIQFSPGMDSPYVGEYYDDAASLEQADLVTIGSADVTGIDAELAAKATISGRVTGADGAPVADVSVNASGVMSPDGGFATTDVNGHYELQVAPGDYRVQFSPASPFVDEYYNDAATAEQADLVTIGTADVTGIDASCRLV